MIYQNKKNKIQFFTFYQDDSTIDQVLLRNMVCAYFFKKELPILSALRLIPVDQILDIVENIDSYPIKKLNEVLVRIIFKDIEPTPLFNFRQEIQKVNSLVKLVSFKKLIFKKMMFGRVHALKKVKELRDLVEKVNKNNQALKASESFQNLDLLPPENSNENDSVSQESQNEALREKFNSVKHFMKDNSNFLVFFIDKGFMIVLREISNMKSHLDIYKNLVKMVPEPTLEKMVEAFILCLKGRHSSFNKTINTHLTDPGNKDANQVQNFMKFLRSSQEFGENRACSSSGFSFGMEVMSEKSSSFFNFDA